MAGLVAVVAMNPDYVLALSCCEKAGSLQQVLAIASSFIVAVLLYLCGKFTWLKDWLPAATDILDEAKKELSKPTSPAERKESK